MITISFSWEWLVVTGPLTAWFVWTAPPMIRAAWKESRRAQSE